MSVNYEILLKTLEHELLHEGRADREPEEELGAPFSAVVPPGPLRSLRFAGDPELQAVALGQLRLGRSNDSPYPAPIRSEGRAVRKVQQALIDLGYPLPQNGDEGVYGQETYGAVLAYKTQFNIRTASGYLDGIVGPKTIAHLDSHFSPGPLPACGIKLPPVIAAEGEFEIPDPGPGLPWVTCDPLLEPSPTGMCDKLLPDQGQNESEGGTVVVAPSPAQFYCINRPKIRLEFTATWVEMLPPSQRPADQRNRAANRPTYDVSFKTFKVEKLVPGQVYVYNITVTAPGYGQVRWFTARQENRIFRVRYSIQESD